jgi:hypothetical protein
MGTLIRGLILVIPNVLIWYVALRKSTVVPDFVFATVFMLAIVLPAVCAWRSTACWMLFSLSPFMLWALHFTHTC